MNTITKYIINRTVQPAVKKYLSKTRVYRYKNITLSIPPDVFHPAFFFSTKNLLKYVLNLELDDKKFLELGAGSGLISFAAAQKNALVTATDINRVAIEYLNINSETNNLPVRIILSDLFDDIPSQQFDIIAINPPFYKKTPKTNAEFAWYCGENGEYFYKLFSSLNDYMNVSTSVLMILSEDCDIDMIKNIAARNNFSLKLLQSKKNILERIFIFSIEKIILNFNNYSLVDGVYVNPNTTINKNFEEKYIALRKKENRVYTDEEVKHLPLIESTHPHYKEWILRTQSANKLFEYFQQKNKSLRILEVGCGNGWLSNFLSQIKNCYVVGLDINFSELQQAAKVFKKENLIFMYDVLSEKLLSEFNFDIIVFAASAQYFSSIKQIIKMALSMLNKDAEIHILDTNFYKTNAIEPAKNRTQTYYVSLGFPEFSAYYYHHALDELNVFSVDKLYEPSSVKNIFSRNRNPFPWFCVKEKQHE